MKWNISVWTPPSLIQISNNTKQFLINKMGKIDKIPRNNLT